MHIVVYLGLNAFYFFFGVLLINTIRKEFIKQSQDKMLENLYQNEIFIPDTKNKNNYYLNEILKKNMHPKYLFILPDSDKLVKLDEFWNIVSIKYQRHHNFLTKFVIPAFDINSYQDRLRLESFVYLKQDFPIKFILSGKNVDRKIFILQNKKESYDLFKLARDKDLNMIQYISDDIFKYMDKMFVLETYMVIVRRKEGGKIKLEMYRYYFIKYLLVDIKNKKVVNCFNVNKLFETLYFNKCYLNLVRLLDLNFKFIYKNISSYIQTCNTDLNSTCFEIFAIQYMMNSKFQPFLYNISRNLSINNPDDKILYDSLLKDVCDKVRQQENIDSKLVKIS